MEAPPQNVFDLFPKWECQCPNCGLYSEFPPPASCPNCKTPFNEKEWRVPPRFLRSPEAMADYVHRVLAPHLSPEERKLLFQHFTIFLRDGFETNDFSKWTDTSTSDVSDTATVVTTDPHRGTYHADFECDGSAANEWSFAYINVTAQSLLYVRAYMKFKTALPPTGSQGFVIQLRGTDGIFEARVTDAPVWRLQYLDGAGITGVNAASGPSLDTWYCVELYGKVDATNGEATLYIDGVNVASVSGKDTDGYGDITQVRLGLGLMAATYAHGLYADCVLIADIGPVGTTSIWPLSPSKMIVNSGL